MYSLLSLSIRCGYRTEWASRRSRHEHKEETNTLKQNWNLQNGKKRREFNSLLPRQLNVFMRRWTEFSLLLSRSHCLCRFLWQK